MRALGAWVVGKKNGADHELDRDREHTWFCLSKAIGIIAILCGSIVFGWILSADGEATMLRRAEIATPLGMAFAAALTFTTVVWRGLVGEFQAREQKRANDAKDDENTSNLLVEGIKLISSDLQTNEIAGIAISTLLLKKNDRQLSNVVINILADYVIKYIDVSERFYIVNQARTAMNEAVHSGYLSDRELELDVSDEVEQADEFKIYNGFKLMTYRNGIIRNAAYSTIARNDCTYLISTLLKNTELNKEYVRYSSCKFDGCKIRSIDHRDIRINSYTNCDFSDLQIHNVKLFDTKTYPELPDLVSCYYYRDSPPTGDGAHLILPYLEARDRPTN